MSGHPRPRCLHLAQFSNRKKKNLQGGPGMYVPGLVQGDHSFVLVRVSCLPASDVGVSSFCPSPQFLQLSCPFLNH